MVADLVSVLVYFEPYLFTLFFLRAVAAEQIVADAVVAIVAVVAVAVVVVQLVCLLLMLL